MKKENKENPFNVFIFPSRQQQQEQQGFQDKCFGFSIRRQRQVYPKKKKKK
jgi:hypothetical protein